MWEEINSLRSPHSKDCKINENNAHRRTIRNNEKLDHWNARNCSVQMNAVLTPDDYDLSKTECSCDFIEVLPDEVIKTNSKIKWGGENKKTITHSRYHNKCFSNKPKLKSKKPNIKRNIVPSISCCECGDGVEPSKTKFKNECYCSYPPDKPLLPGRPVITKPNPKRTLRSGLKSPDGDIESSRTLETLRKARALLQDYIPESEFLRKLQKEAKEVYDCQCCACKTKEETTNLKFTKHRHLLEEAYKDVENHKHFEKFACHNSPRKTPKNSPMISSPNITSQTSPRFSSLSPQVSSQKLTSFSSNFIDYDKIHEIKQIRKNNYFDTHSTNINLSKKPIPEHKCVHKFILDNRLLPKPVHCNSFGVSCCTICNKPMESNSLPMQKEEEEIRFIDYTKLIESGSSKEEIFSVTKQISPRKINIGSNKEVIELNVPPIFITDQRNLSINKLKSPYNSWALRYQKGVN